RRRIERIDGRFPLWELWELHFLPVGVARDPHDQGEQGRYDHRPDDPFRVHAVSSAVCPAGGASRAAPKPLPSGVTTSADGSSPRYTARCQVRTSWDT